MKILSKGRYYGSKQSELNINGILLSEYDYRTARTDWHFHENPYFMYVLRGDMYDVNRRQKSACPAGTLIFHNWQEAHYNEKASAQAGGFHVEFERAWFDRQKLDIDLWEGSQVIEHPSLHHLLGKLYYEFRQQDEFTGIAAELLLLQICEKTQAVRLPSARSAPSWIAPLKELIHENHPDLSLKFLSETLGVHPVHLSRAIPRYLSSNLGEYLRQQKVKRALGLLIDARLSLTEIAYACDFADQSHFARTFKRYFGLTPGAYRRALG